MDGLGEQVDVQAGQTDRVDGQEGCDIGMWGPVDRKLALASVVTETFAVEVDSLDWRMLVGVWWLHVGLWVMRAGSGTASSVCCRESS